MDQARSADVFGSGRIPRHVLQDECLRSTVDWRKILELSQETTQRWMPDEPDESNVAFTDAVWTPRDGEVRLRCEECPKPTSSDFRPSRYFHAV